MDLKIRTACIMLCIVFIAGCASRQSGYLAGPEAAKAGKGAASQPSTQPSSQRVDPAEAAYLRAEQKWARRDEMPALKEALAIYKQVLEHNGKHRKAMERLARGYYLLAYGHAKTKEELLAAHDEGARWGERIMGLRAEFIQKIKAGEKDYQAISVAQKEDATGIYWAYANLARWSVEQGFTTVLKNKSKLKAFVSRVAELDDHYYHGAGDRGLGAFYAKAPSFAGGDLKKALHHFEKSLKIAPGYFGTKVLMARYYATKKQDRELFEKLLNEVIKGDPNVLPDVVPIQKMEQEKAKKLLAEAEDKFE